MAEILNTDGVQIPSLGSIVMYVAETPEDGAPIVWPSIITQVVNEGEMLIRLTAFPPGEQPRGILATVTYGDPQVSEVNTWHWPPRV
ncbi:hypothetical protein GCM10010423_64740 [Streptomyces levis]|uniref:Uncharacterized protein n=1 Tax=Streptomyces levis TaxID=285566 RepID=A0ABN3P3J7_9ACTN